MKIVLEIKGNEKPSDNDILVYNSKEEVWEMQRKSIFLTPLFEEVKKQAKVNDELFDKWSQMSQDISSIAKIVKENIEE